jgi:hypothetical protein
MSVLVDIGIDVPFIDVEMVEPIVMWYLRTSP